MTTPLHLTLPVQCPYVAYLMGFLWGDGYLTKSPTWDSVIIGCEFQASDLDHLLRAFGHLGKWHLFKRERYGKTYCRLYCADKPLYHQLVKLGYRQKHLSHRRALEAIAPELRRFFLLGLFDADGSLTERDGRMANFSICSDRRQQWGALDTLMRESGIRCHVRRKNDKRGHGHSFIKTGKITEISKLYDILYSDTPEDMYMPRKHAAFKRSRDYILHEYLSTRFGARFDYTLYPFQDIRVIRPIDQSKKRWQWECQDKEGRLFVRPTEWLGEKRRRQEAGLPPQQILLS